MGGQDMTKEKFKNILEADRRLYHPQVRQAIVSSSSQTGECIILRPDMIQSPVCLEDVLELHRHNGDFERCPSQTCGCVVVLLEGKFCKIGKFDFLAVAR